MKRGTGPQAAARLPPTPNKTSMSSSMPQYASSGSRPPRTLTTMFAVMLQWARVPAAAKLLTTKAHHVFALLPRLLSMLLRCYTACRALVSIHEVSWIFLSSKVCIEHAHIMTTAGGLGVAVESVHQRQRQHTRAAKGKGSQ